MRLIDADALIDRIKNSDDYLGKWDEMNLHDIEVAPTIHAITIDELGEYIDNNVDAFGALITNQMYDDLNSENEAQRMEDLWRDRKKKMMEK